MATPVMDEARLRRAFLEEAEDLSLRLGSTLQALDAERGNLPLINEVFRFTHSLKSESALMGFSSLSSLAHGMEDVLGMARAGCAPAAPRPLPPRAPPKTEAPRVTEGPGETEAPRTVPRRETAGPTSGASA